MPANKSALLRYKIIDRRIRNKYKSFPSVEDLRQACEDELFNSTGERISKSTIEKDLRSLREDEVLGYLAPIRFNKTKGGYYYTDTNYTLSSLPLNEDELRAIRFASQTLYQFRELPLFREFQSAIQKIFSKVEFSDQRSKTLDKMVQFESEPVSGQEENLPILLQAVVDKHPVSFSYQRYDTEEIKKHLIHPLLLKEYRNRWYAVSYVPSRSDVLVYSLDRITDLKIEKGTFRHPHDFDPDIYFKHSLGITTFNHTKPEKIVLSFSTLQGRYLRSKPMHNSQRILLDNKNEFRIELYVQVTWELIYNLLGYGKEVKVVKPVNLKNLIKKTLGEAFRQYQ